MFTPATLIGSGPLLSSHPVKRTPTSNGFYRTVAIFTVFAMMFGGLLLIPKAAEAASATATARVNLRIGPGLDQDVIGVIPDGASITVDGDPISGYYPVTYDGVSGYAAVDFIRIGGDADTGGSDSGDEGSNEGESPVSGGAPTGTAWVTVARLNFRSGPSISDGVISVLTNGTAVELTGQQSNGYWQGTANGTTGWAASEYLTTSGAPSDPEPDSDPTPGSENSAGSVAVGDAATGSATVTANLNLRSGPGTDFTSRTIMRSGSTVELRGDPQNGFYPLSYNGTTGWAAGDWLDIGGGATDPEPDPDTGNGGGSVPVGTTATGSATVTAGLNLRTGPGLDYNARMVMPSGATVELRGDPQAGYYPLSYNGTTGWASGDWLDIGGSTPEPDPEPDPGSGSGSVPVGNTASGSATVTTGLNLRSGPGLGYTVRTIMPSGAAVELRGDPQAGYYPLSYNGTTGWASGDWLDIGGSAAPDPDPEPQPGTPGSVVPVGNTVTGSAVVTASLNLRAGPSTGYDVRAVMRTGAVVELRGDPRNGFYPLGYNGATGWAAGDWLDIGGSAPDPGTDDGSGNGEVPQYLYTSAAVNMRSGPTIDDSVVWVLPPNTRVTITGAAQNSYYPASWAHVSGWVHGDYLSPTYQGPSTEGKEEIVAIIYEAADYYGQPRADMLRVAQCESHLDPSVTNRQFPNDPNAARGLFQFRPSTWATTPYADEDIFDARANAFAAAWMWSVGRRNEWACQ